jgi:hypothetical protein
MQTFTTISMVARNVETFKRPANPMYAVRAVNVQKKNWTDAEATLGEYF